MTFHLRTSAFRITYCGLIDVTESERPGFEKYVRCVPKGDEVRYLQQLTIGGRTPLRAAEVCDKCLEECTRKVTGDLEVLRAMRDARQGTLGVPTRGRR